MIRVVEVLTEKVPAKCPFCGHDDIDVQNMMALVPLYSGLAFPLIPANAHGIMPSLVCVCKNCGNTQLYNIHVLGLAEELGVPPAGKAVV